jgi:hypothetical protein
MPDFGIATACTQYTIQPAELGRWAETHGFESLWFAEHTHIPTSRKTPYPMGELPEYAKEGFDPFIGLTAAAVVTTKLKLGTSVSLIPEHHPIIWLRRSPAWIVSRTGDSCSASAGDGMPRRWPTTALLSRTAGRSRANGSSP